MFNREARKNNKELAPKTRKEKLLELAKIRSELVKPLQATRK